MERTYSVGDIARLVGVSAETIKNWENARLIPQAARVGIQKRRIWGPTKAQQIIEFAGIMVTWSRLIKKEDVIKTTHGRWKYHNVIK